MTYFTHMSSPIGRLRLVSDGAALTGLFMLDSDDNTKTQGGEENASAIPFPEATRQLQEYFAGERDTFDLPIDLKGTPFQVRVWQALLEIPYGTTEAYSQLARRIGEPNACRAVGLANGRNPVSIIVPCHRVIGASGKLVGYGGGVERKRVLLDLERARTAPGLFA